MGLTDPSGVHFPLRWGIISASAIASDWIKSLQDVPGATVTAVAARDKSRAEVYAEAHGIPTAYDDYEKLCNDPNVDIVYIASKTWDHFAHMMMAIKAKKHVLCEKPFTDTSEQAHQVYKAADAAGVFCQEGMWTRFFPAVEHARAAIDSGMIGDIVLVQNDYSDRVYALNPAPFAFGSDELPVIAAAGRKMRPQKHVPGQPFSAHGSTPSGVVLQYTNRKGIAMITFPAGRFREETQYVGTKGRITLEAPSHHPSALTIRAGRPGVKVAPGKQYNPMKLDPKEGFTGDWEPTHGQDDQNPSNGPFMTVNRFEYPLPTPAPISRGQPAGHRWTGEKLIAYKGWTWSGGNQHGFMYQAQAVHRCMAAGLKECPQFTRQESLHVCEIIDEINRQCAEKGF